MFAPARPGASPTTADDARTTANARVVSADEKRRRAATSAATPLTPLTCRELLGHQDPSERAAPEALLLDDVELELLFQPRTRHLGHGQRVRRPAATGRQPGRLDVRGARRRSGAVRHPR